LIISQPRIVRHIVGSAASAIILLVLALPINAQAVSTLTGRITGASDALPVRDATVDIASIGLTAQTDSSGRFVIESVPKGVHEIRVRRLGYKVAYVTIETPLDDRLEIPLDMDVLKLDSIAVRAGNMLQRRRQAAPHTTKVFGRMELSKSGNFMIDALRTHGVQIADCSSRSELHCVYSRGAVVRPSVCIDDLPALDGLATLIRYPVGALESVEVYAGGRMIRAYSTAYMERIRGGSVHLGAIDMNLRRC
jgi:hypothetical protein